MGNGTAGSQAQETQTAEIELSRTVIPTEQ